MTELRCKVADAVIHFKIVYTAESGVIKQQNVYFCALLKRCYKLGVEHKIAAVAAERVNLPVGSGKL